ncbi:hypothetical protein OAD79_02105 [Flavobacteriales bacterium]|nr:hypothetical protein [Flavobacteriales bacterium]
MKKITLFITIIIATLTSHAQFGDCGLINLSATGTAGNNYSFQVGSNVDSLVTAGVISSNNIQHRWRAYHYNNFQDLFNNSFDTSSTCINCLWSSTLSQDIYMSNTMMDTLTMMMNMTILDNLTCVTIFGVSFIPSNNNNSNGGFSYLQLNQSTGIPTVNDKEKVLYKTYNVLGQEVNSDEVNNEIIIYLYNDETSEKKYVSKLVD